MRGSPETPSGRAASALLLLLAAAAAFLLRSWFATSVLPAPGRMQGETTQSYRYARMIGEGGAVPATDTLALHPEGFRTSENSIFEEYIAGGLFRLVGGDFDSFLRFFCLAFPLLGMAGLALWLSAAGYDRRQAIAGGLLYGFMVPAMLRARGDSLYRETVAVPLLLLLCALIEGSTSGGRRPGPLRAAATVLLVLAVNASWKVSGFIMALLLFYLLVRHTAGRLPRSATVPVAAAQLASALAIPHMVHDGAILSPASIIAAGLLAASAARMSSMPLLVILGSATAVLAGGNPSMAHVGALIAAKLRFLLSHPADPLLLPPDARLFWVSGYETPTAGQVLLLFGPLLLIAAFGLRRFYRRAPGLIQAALPVMAAGYLFMDRLHVLLAPILTAPLIDSMKKPWRYPAFALLLGAQAALLVPAAHLLQDAGLDPSPQPSLLTEAEVGDLLSWASGSTRPDQAFLAYWHVSGMLSAYASRPTVLHTFFESAENRRRIHEFASAMQEPEDSLVAMMERYDADLVVYQADFLLDRSTAGLLYLAGRTSPGDRSVAVLMQYHPEALRRLALLHQGPSTRVFGLDVPAVPAPPGVLFNERYTGIFSSREKALAAITDPLGTAESLGEAGDRNGSPDLLSASLTLVCSSGGDQGTATWLLQHLVTLHLDGLYRIEPLREDFHVYLDAFGPDPQITLDLVRLLADAGLEEEAQSELEGLR